MPYCRLVGTAALTVLVVLSWVPVAGAAPCTADTAATPVAGVLALDTMNSDDVTVPSFTHKTEPTDVSFVLTVTGCTLPAQHDVEVEVRGGGSKAVTFAAPKRRGGSSLTLDGIVDPKRFDPGEHKPRVRVSSPSGQVKLQSFTLTLQRKEPPLVPVVIAFLVAIGAVGYAYLVAREAAVQAYDKKKAEQDNKEPATTELSGLLLLTKMRETRKANKREAKKPKPQQREKVEKVKHGSVPTWVFVGVGATIGAGSAFAASYLTATTWDLAGLLDPGALVAAVATAAVGGATAPIAKAVMAADLPKQEDRHFVWMLALAIGVSQLSFHFTWKCSVA
jgi:hypothetical protein